MYARPYRLFDVDDLILNTIGGIIGFSLVPIFQKMLPDLHEITEKSKEKSEKISFVRRLIAFLIDILMIQLIAAIIQLFIKNRQLFWIEEILGCLIVGFIFPLIFKWSTLGMKVVKIRYGSTINNKSMKLWQLLTRNIVGFGLTLGNFFAFNIALKMIWEVKVDDRFIYIGLSLVLLLPLMFFAIDYLLVLKTGHRTWYEKLSRTKLVSNFKTQTIK
ncbi:hypothetical protein KIMC2_10530 [Xylocopilactobacillus apis]|uniref:RDD family protein n=1 Tax=Xylocopilactobacillus apis TaxID=2932183 RepID=A0AAU9DEB4_9LACO|nr:hypothetical protein KIMC2_10530 [Xylocopilactobacillus apis]